jgi:hypothetical protein
MALRHRRRSARWAFRKELVFIILSLSSCLEMILNLFVGERGRMSSRKMRLHGHLMILSRVLTLMDALTCLGPFIP